MIPLQQLLLVATVFLVIPAAIIIGHRRPTGPIVISSSAALAASIVFWIVLGGISSLSESTAGTGIVIVLVLYAGLLLQLAAWTLAINAAALTRRWWWVLLLIIAGYISFAQLLSVVFGPSQCFSLPSSEGAGVVCPGTSPYLALLLNLGHFLGPAIALVYGLRPTRRRDPNTLAAGALGVSPLDVNSEADTEPGLHRERI